MTYEEVLTVMRNRSLVTLRDMRALNRDGKTDTVMAFLGIAQLPNCACEGEHNQHDMSAYLGQVIREKTEVRRNFLRRRVFYFGADECDLYFAEHLGWVGPTPRCSIQWRAHQMVPNSDWWWDDQPFCIRIGVRWHGRWHHWSFMFGGKTSP